MINTRLFPSLARLALRRPWTVLLAFLLLGAASVVYTIGHLGINNNTAQLLSEDLPFQQVRLKLEQAFPQDAATIIIVVESATAEQTAAAATAVNRRLHAAFSLFESAYIPEDEPFFRRQGFLFLELAQLDALAARLIDAQPFIGYLSRHYHFTGLTELIGQGLAEAKGGDGLPLQALLQALDQAVLATQAGQPHLLSWQRLLSGPDSEHDPTKRLIIAKPRLDFRQLMPAGQAMAFLRALQTEMQASHPGVALSLTGEVALEHEEMETVNRDTLVSGIASFLLVCSALWLGLRSWRLLFATLVALIVGLVLTAGFAAVAIGHLNLISVAFAVLYIGLGVDFATHLCLHYQACRRQGMAGDPAITHSVTAIGPSLLLCALTTAIGFFAFIPTDFKGVSELGVISGAGMFIGLAVSLSLLPALLRLLPVQSVDTPPASSLPAWVYTFPFRHARAICLGAGLLAVLAGLSLTQLRFDSASINLRDPQSPSVIAFKKLLRGTHDSPFAISALTDSLASADALAAELARLPSVGQAVTLGSLVPAQQAQKLEIVEQLNLIMPTQFDGFTADYPPSNVRAALLGLNRALDQARTRPGSPGLSQILTDLRQHIEGFVQQADAAAQPEIVYVKLEASVLLGLPHTLLQLRDGLQASAFGIDEIPPDVRRHWVGEGGLYRVLATPAHDLNDTGQLEGFVRQVMDAHPAVFGLPIGDVTSGRAVVEAFVQAFSSAMLLIVILLLLMTRSLKSTLLVMTPLLLAALLTAACNVLLDNPFNFANIIVLPLLLGMGVDSGIHIMHHLRQPTHAVADTLRSSAARGVFFSALTTLCSFSSLAFNSHRGTASMGLLLAIGISMTVLCTLLVLPAISARRPATAKSGKGR